MCNMQKLTNIAGQRSSLIKIQFVISYHPFFILMALTCGLQHARSCGYEAPSRTTVGTPFGSELFIVCWSWLYQRAVIYSTSDDIHTQLNICQSFTSSENNTNSTIITSHWRSQSRCLHSGGRGLLPPGTQGLIDHRHEGHQLWSYRTVNMIKVILVIKINKKFHPNWWAFCFHRTSIVVGKQRDERSSSPPAALVPA